MQPLKPIRKKMEAANTDMLRAAAYGFFPDQLEKWDAQRKLESSLIQINLFCGQCGSQEK